MKYWYLSRIVHTADQPNWLRNYKWTEYMKDVDGRVKAGDVVLIGNQGNGIFAWGIVLRRGEETELGEYLIEIGRGNLQYSLIRAEVLAQIPELSLIVSSPRRPFKLLTKQQARAATSLIPEPKPAEPVGYDFTIGSHVSIDEDLQVEYKDVSVSQIPKEVYEYAVAYARGIGGNIFFGISDNGLVRGINLDFAQRNNLRKRIEEKLSTIDPPLLAVEDYTINFENVIDTDGNPISDSFVIDVEVNRTGKEHRTAGGKAFHKSFSGRRKV